MPGRGNAINLSTFKGHVEDILQDIINLLDPRLQVESNNSAKDCNKKCDSCSEGYTLEDDEYFDCQKNIEYINKDSIDEKLQSLRKLFIEISRY